MGKSHQILDKGFEIAIDVDVDFNTEEYPYTITVGNGFVSGPFKTYVNLDISQLCFADLLELQANLNLFIEEYGRLENLRK
jgi:hypothetical protein